VYEFVSKFVDNILDNIVVSLNHCVDRFVQRIVILSYCHNSFKFVHIVRYCQQFKFVRDWFADGYRDLNYSTEASNENPMTIDSERERAWKLQHLRAWHEFAPSLARRSQAQPGSESAPWARRGRNSVRGQSRCWHCHVTPGRRRTVTPSQSTIFRGIGGGGARAGGNLKDSGTLNPLRCLLPAVGLGLGLRVTVS
jgi:hypothetical protein